MNKNGRKVTLKQVAALADVSPMTVSNFVNGRTENMRSGTYQRVKLAVNQLKYRPDTSARNLRQSRHLSIGMIIVDSSPHYLSDGYTTQIVSGLSNALNSSGYTLQLEGVLPGKLAESSLIRHIRTDGICLMLSGQGKTRREQLEVIKSIAQPQVIFLEQLRLSEIDACSVISSDKAGGRLLAEHLVERGAKKVVMLLPSLNYWKSMHARLRGAREAFAFLNDTISIKILDCGDGGFAHTRQVLDNEFLANGIPDTVMAANDQIGMSTLSFLRNQNIDVPEQVRVTGFNAFETREFSYPMLTSIYSPGYEMGQIGGRELVNRLHNGQFSQSQIKLPVKFVPGETT